MGKALASGQAQLVLAAQRGPGKNQRAFDLYAHAGHPCFYKDLDFAKKTHWLRLLEADHQA